MFRGPIRLDGSTEVHTRIWILNTKHCHAEL